MEWDADSLNRFMKHFGVTANQISVGSGISSRTVYNLKYGSYDFDNYNDRLTAYYLALRKAKRAEHESLIEYYESFKP